ncbi:hypothetical protein CNMCM8686_008212 [Aspergillus fumigatus]|nr:hypothetical protein CNMCM8686_008212 [Aspergillus fumigatus]
MVLVAMAVVVLAMLMAGELARRHSLGGDDGRTREARGLHQPRQPRFEVQAVDEQYPGSRQFLGIAWRWLVFMGVAVRAHQRAQLDIVAAHLAHDVAQDRKACHDRQRFGGMRRAEGRGQPQAGGGQQGAAARERRQNGTHSESP